VFDVVGISYSRPNNSLFFLGLTAGFEGGSLRFSVLWHLARWRREAGRKACSSRNTNQCHCAGFGMLPSDCYYGYDYLLAERALSSWRLQ